MWFRGDWERDDESNCTSSNTATPAPSLYLPIISFLLRSSYLRADSLLCSPVSPPSLSAHFTLLRRRLHPPPVSSSISICRRLMVLIGLYAQLSPPFFLFIFTFDLFLYIQIFSSSSLLIILSPSILDFDVSGNPSVFPTLIVFCRVKTEN